MNEANDWCSTCGRRVGSHLLYEYLKCLGKSWEWFFR